MSLKGGKCKIYFWFNLYKITIPLPAYVINWNNSEDSLGCDEHVPFVQCGVADFVFLTKLRNSIHCVLSVKKPSLTF